MTQHPRRRRTAWFAAVLCAVAGAAASYSALRDTASAEGKLTVAYVAPSLDISYWQWVAYGVRTKAAELGMNYIELTAENSPGTQMNDVRTALTRGVNAIVMGPVSSSSTPPVLRLLKQKGIPIAFTGIGPQPGETDYTSAVTANNYETGKAEGSFVCKLAKDRGGNKVGMLSLPQDRENAQKYLRGAQEAFKADGCDLVAILQTHGLTVKEAVDQANDLLTAHSDIRRSTACTMRPRPGQPRRCRRAVSWPRSASPPPTAARPRSSCSATESSKVSSCKRP